MDVAAATMRCTVDLFRAAGLGSPPAAVLGASAPATIAVPHAGAALPADSGAPAAAPPAPGSRDAGSAAGTLLIAAQAGLCSRCVARAVGIAGAR
jgi:tRNA U54 and U55 pseudouridine synthase Pus10